MADLFDYFKRDHERCDALWVAVESAEDADVASTFEAFSGTMLRHLAMEEEVMFPAFEQATGMVGGGPTAVMRMEHEQMRGLLGGMKEAAAQGDTEAVLNLGDTLLMLIQQHNMKEEQILYPMADRVLSGHWPALAAELEGFGR
ncbi:MAG TPA: hemerythrin domain-containing protein [Myxococcota bacterium]|nr:hemerythrin domain-containing protein [Myxococcota bacterium]